MTSGPANVTGNVNAVPKNIRMAPMPLAKRAKTIEAVCEIYDPFCPSAIGARIPDGQQRTMTASGRGTLTMATGATGGLSYAVLLPAAPFGWYLNAPTSFPSTSSTLGGYSNLSSGLFNSYGHEYRVVSCGFVLRAIQSASTAQGYFTIQTQQDFYPTVAAVSGDFLALDNTTVANYPGMEYTYIFRPTNKVLARQFAGLSNNTTNPGQTGWPAAVVYYQGGATGAANVAIIEYFVNIEWTVNSESPISPIMPPPVPAAPAVLKVLDKAHAELNPVLKGGVDMVGGFIKDFVGDAITEMQSVSLSDMLAALAFV